MSSICWKTQGELSVRRIPQATVRCSTLGGRSKNRNHCTLTRRPKHLTNGQISQIDRTTLRQSARTYANAVTSTPQHVAVLGAGITGLASAWYITQEYPDAKVTIYESKDAIGGWVKSSTVDVGDGEIIFESGPRSLRPQVPNGTVALRLAASLNMENEILVTKRSSPAAQNRFVYYPDHLVKMPGPGQKVFDVINNIFREPIFNGITRAMLSEWRTETRHSSVKDESVGGFISRRFGKPLANNLVSAVMHGIYAGDIWQLSARSILSTAWAQEARHGTLSQAFWEVARTRASWSFCDDIELQLELQEPGWSPAMRERMMDCSVFTFQKGVGSLAERLHHRLAHKSNVTIKTATRATSLSKRDENGMIKLTSRPSTSTSDTDTESNSFSHVIATIPSPAVRSLIPSSLIDDMSTTGRTSRGVRDLGETDAVSVAVVNFYFRTPDLLRKISPPNGLPPALPNGLAGFGYLIPQSVPFAQNPERALGVIFDSDISPDLWTSVPKGSLGTKLTVMLGGHWWNGWASLPSESDCEEMARSVLKRHLGIEEAPVASRVTLQEKCIPQYTVGHEERMAAAHDALISLYGGQVKVAGSWYTGVGVNDCLRSAYELVRAFKAKDASERSGLERFAWGRPMALVKRSAPGVLDIIRVDEAGKKQGYFQNVQTRADDRE